MKAVVLYGPNDVNVGELPVLPMGEYDVRVKVAYCGICGSDYHKYAGKANTHPIKYPVPLGHEISGIVAEVGEGVTQVKVGDRVTVDPNWSCGKCYFCQNGWVNNCIDPNGGWALGCRMDGGQAEYVRVPYADQGLNQIPDSVTDEQALFVGDVLATGYWAAQISETKEGE